ncbi:MAG: hypothetical protein M3173_00900 [Chloroflexota bacterium]|nr:hypothetical protein [Chloroflexota bacterium]
MAESAKDGYRNFRSPLALVAEAAQLGQLSDPGERPFRRWDGGLPLRTHHGVHRYPSVFYSPYQLLALKAIEPLLSEMRANRTEDGRWSFHLDALTRAEVAGLDGCRRLAVLLHALDMRYLPDITLRIRHADYWEAHDSEFDVTSRLRAFAVEAEAVFQAAESLLVSASFRDPLGDWYEVVREAHPATWSDLKGDARLAMDYRIASEILLSAVDDLGRFDLTDVPPRTGRYGRVVLDDRLLPNPARLDELLTNRGISPHPSVLLVVEGDTEEFLMPRVLETLFGRPVPPTLIEIVNMKTIDRDLDLFARHAAGLRLGEPTGDGSVRLVRPPTRLLVAVDREKRFATKEKQGAFRNVLVRRLHEMLPPQYQSANALAELDTLIEIHDWGRHPWEFANFTDSELASGILMVAEPRPGVGRREIMASLRTERAAGRSPDVERVSAGWPRAVRKRMLAEALWPRLEAKLKSPATSHASLPARRVAVRALQLAMQTHRRGSWMRVADGSDNKE